MGIKHVPEPLHHTGPNVYGAANHPVGDGLHRLGDFTKDSEPLTTVGEFRALQVRHLESELMNKIEVNE